MWPRSLEERAHGPVDRPALDAGTNHRDRRARAPRPTARATRLIVGSAAPTRNVRVMSAKHALSKCCGKRSQRTVSSFSTRPRPGSWPSAVWAPCATIMSSPRQPRAANAPAAAARNSSQVSGSPSTTRPPSARLRAREERGDRRHSGLGCLLGGRGSPRARSRRLAPPPVVEEPLVDDQLDAVGPQPVGDTEREALGDDALGEAERRHHLREQRREHLVGVEAVAQQLVERERLGWLRARSSDRRCAMRSPSTLQTIETRRPPTSA